MGEPVTDARAAIERMRDQLPEEEKNGNVGKIITYMLDLLQSGWSFRHAQENVGELCRLGQHIETLQQLPETGGEAILKVREFRKENSTQEWIDSYLRHLPEIISLDESFDEEDKITTDHENTNKLILDSVKRYHQNRSNEMITNMVTGSAWVAAFQALKIYMAWKTISKASNLIMENPNEFTTIDNKLQTMKSIVLEVLELCDRNPKDRSVSQKMMRINTLFTSTLGKINNLRVKIDSHIQRLDLVADYSAIDGVVNLATAGTQAFQLWHTWENLSSYTKSLAMASIVVFTVLGLGNFRAFFLSQDTLKDLRKDLKEAIRLQHMLEDLHEQAAQAINAMPENQDLIDTA